MKPMRKRVVITGMGWITPLGLGLETVWRRRLGGVSGAPGGGGLDMKNWGQVALATFERMREIEQEPSMTIAHLAMEFNARGPSLNCLTACAASTQAIGEATEIIRRGDADVMISGGAHSMIHPFGVTGFNRLHALSEFNAN